MTFEKLRRVAIAQQIDKEARAAENFDIFLAGPFVLVEEADDHSVNIKTSATKLRYKLYHFLTRKGHNIYLGEDNSLRETGEAHFSEKNNAVLYERHYIKKHTDAVIILPSSPGSFCEVGDWVSDKDICSCMLILIDKKYENERNYINDGIVKLAKTHHADVRYHDYADLDGFESICESFIESIAADARIEELYGRA